MERQLFSWENWDQVAVFDFVFYDVTLMIPIGNFKIGEKFAIANISYEEGTLELVKNKEDEKGTCFKIKLDLA